MGRVSIATVLLVLLAASSYAQSPYVAGAIGADVSRFSHATSSLYPSPSGDAEVLSGGLRVGTSIGSNWGVELEFVRSGRIRQEIPLIYTLQAGSGTASGLPSAVAAVLPGIIGGIATSPIAIDYRSETTLRHTTFDTVAWVRQSAGSSVDLVYLAGIAFDRERSEVSQSIAPALATIVRPTPYRSTFIQYSTRPLVGMEARIRLTSKLRLIPGVRVQGLADGWLLRPHVGLGWFF